MAIFQKVGENLLHLWFARVNEGLFCKLYRSKTEKQQKKMITRCTSQDQRSSAVDTDARKKQTKKCGVCVEEGN